MREIDEALDGLIDALLETEEYCDYQKAKAELYRYPGLKDQVDEFRQRNFRLQQLELDSDAMMAEIEKFEREYESFRANPIVNRFLSCELAFVRLMQGIYESIMENIDFE